MKCADEVSLGNRFWEGKYVQRTCSLIGASFAILARLYE